MKASFGVAVAVVVTLVSTGVGFGMEVSVASSLTFDAVAAKNRPVSKSSPS
jgi:hypothetical protein